METEKHKVVIDNGSGMCKAGFAGDDAPRGVFPAIIGLPRHEISMVGMGQKSEYVGTEAQDKRGLLTIKYPVKNGIIEDWEGMTKIWRHAFTNELRVKSEECSVLLTEAPLNPTKNRVQMGTTLFEKFGARNIQISIQAVLSLYASGRTTGMIYDSGDGVTHFVPVYEGYALKHAIKRLDIAGREITLYLASLMTANNSRMCTSAEKEIVRDIKEKLSYVAENFEAEIEKYNKNPKKYVSTFELPDHSKISIFSEKFKSAELLFNPSLRGFESPGVHEMIYNSIMSCDIDLRKELYKNIVMSGGSTMIKGLPERMKAEVKALAPESAEVNIIAPAERKYAVWIGGSILASLSSFQKCWISAATYEEGGEELLKKKLYF
ncbi:actin [Cucumispora dikerogammari]|nr:actin [Cucumispora dikerogammari]